LDTLPGPEPDHLGIVSDRVGPSGLPLLINNWTDGHRTAEMDLLGWVPATHRFRVPLRAVRSTPEHTGLSGLLGRRGLRIPAGHDQVVLVVAPLWSSSGGSLFRCERHQESWHQVGKGVAVRLGGNGLGRGLGLHAEALAGVEDKREGDRRSPAGVFLLATAFGPGGRRPYKGDWPWRSVDDRDRYVDDPRSHLYNTWQRQPATGQPAWNSAEKLSIYSLGIIVEHNRAPAKPGAGSAIFLHAWKDPSRPTLGCTSMRRSDLVDLVGWLRPQAKPVLVQVAGQLF
jgi:hypothetical protein